MISPGRLVSQFCFLAGSSGELWGYRERLGLGVGRETDRGLHPSSNGLEDDPAWGPPGA